MGFWNQKLQEYQEALAAEEQMEVREDSMIQLLKERIQECLSHLS
jgi:hypothetical protein